MYNFAFKIISYILNIYVFLFIINSAFSDNLEFDAKSDTYFQFRPVTFNYHARETQPLYEYITLGARNVGVQGLSIYASGWAVSDVNEHIGNDARNRGDLRYGYVEWKTLKNALALKIGRHFVYSGTGFGNQIDGLSLSYKGLNGFGASVHTGLLSPLRFNYSRHLKNNLFDYNNLHGGDDYYFGTRVHYKVFSKGHLGVSYSKTTNDARKASNVLGVDFSARPFKYWRTGEINGSAVADLISKELQEFYTTFKFTLPWITKLKIMLDYEFMVPSLRIPKTSIFSVFSTTSYIDFGTRLTYQLSTGAQVTGLVKYRTFSEDYFSGYLLGLKTVLPVLKYSQGHLVGFELNKLFETSNGYSHLRGFFKYNLYQKQLSIFADSHLFYYDIKLNNFNYSFSLLGGLTYVLSKNLNFGLSSDYSVNPYFEREVLIFAKLIYSMSQNSVLNTYKPVYSGQW